MYRQWWISHSSLEKSRYNRRDDGVRTGLGWNIMDTLEDIYRWWVSKLVSKPCSVCKGKRNLEVDFGVEIEMECWKYRSIFLFYLCYFLLFFIISFCWHTSRYYSFMPKYTNQRAQTSHQFCTLLKTILSTPKDIILTKKPYKVLKFYTYYLKSKSVQQTLFITPPKLHSFRHPSIHSSLSAPTLALLKTNTRTFSTDLLISSMAIANCVVKARHES